MGYRCLSGGCTADRDIAAWDDSVIGTAAASAGTVTSGMVTFVDTDSAWGDAGCDGVFNETPVDRVMLLCFETAISDGITLADTDRALDDAG